MNDKAQHELLTRSVWLRIGRIGMGMLPTIAIGAGCQDCFGNDLQANDELM